MQEKKPRTTTVSSRYSLGEAASRFEGSERDVVSAGDLLRKLHPGMGAPNWIQVPRDARCGKRIPFWAGIMGRSFPYKQNKARCLRLMQTARLLR